MRSKLRSFLHFYSIKPGDRVAWLSLIGQSKVGLLTPFTTSYKKSWSEGQVTRTFMMTRLIDFYFTGPRTQNDFICGRDH